MSGKCAVYERTNGNGEIYSRFDFIVYLFSFSSSLLKVGNNSATFAAHKSFSRLRASARAIFSPSNSERIAAIAERSLASFSAFTPINAARSACFSARLMSVFALDTSACAASVAFTAFTISAFSKMARSLYAAFPPYSLRISAARNAHRAILRGRTAIISPPPSRLYCAKNAEIVKPLANSNGIKPSRSPVLSLMAGVIVSLIPFLMKSTIFIIVFPFFFSGEYIPPFPFVRFSKSII